MSPRLATTLIVTVLAFPLLARSSDDFQLVSADEYRRDQAAANEVTADGRTRMEVFDEQLWTRALDAPAIQVVTPDEAAPVRSPVDIFVKFEPAPGAKIALDSLHITYGVLGLDVTDRIRHAATVTEQGIRAKGAELPVGAHSMSIEISDTAGRKSKRKFKFRVGS